MLSDSYRLKKQLGVMYFEIVLFAPLRCINDISLMNFPTVPRGGLLYVAMPSLISNWSFDVPIIHFKFHCFNLFYSPSELRSLAPVSFGTAKVGNFFKPANFFLFFFLKLFFVPSVCLLCFLYFKSLSLFISVFLSSLPP